MNTETQNSGLGKHSGGNSYTPLVFLLQSLLCQAGGFCFAMVALSQLTDSRFMEVQSFDAQSFDALWLTGAHALLAYLLAKLLKLPVPWQLFNAILPLALLIPTYFIIPQWLLTIAIVLILLTYIPTFWTRVPFYPSSPETVAALSERLSQIKDYSFLDLGSGFGSPVVELARSNPEGRFYGIEIGPLPYLISWLRSLTNRRVTFKMKSFWATSFDSYDVVYAFLSPTPMAKLWEKVSSEMKPGSLFITNSFAVPAEPYEVIHLDSDKQHSLFIFKF